MGRNRRRIYQDRPLTDDERRMVEDHYRLIPFMLREHPYFLRALGQDCYGIATEALCLAVQRYRPEKGAVSTWVCRYVWGMLNSEVVRRNSRPGTLHIHGTDGNPDRDVEFTASPDHGLRRVDDADQVEWLSRHLHPRQKAVVRMYFADGMTYREIADAIGSTHQLVHQIMDEALGRMRRAAGKDVACG